MVLANRKVARALFWACVLFVFVMAVLPQPPLLPGDPSDKLQHMAAFVVLSLLACRAYPAAPMSRLLVGLSLFGALIELVQAILLVHRDSDIVDWIADTVATGIVLSVVYWRRRVSA